VKIYTRTGDEGETSLFDQQRISKADPRVDAYGDIDELNAWLGVLRANRLAADLDDTIVRIQRDLFAVGAQLADPSDRLAPRTKKAFITDDDIARLEEAIDRFETEVPPLTKFILPGGAPAGADIHVARTVCRRAERHMIGLTPKTDAVLIRYINRLSDLLFVLARVVNHRAQQPETEW
jgi:cob(I)alamin adenosyltransferase